MGLAHDYFAAYSYVRLSLSVLPVFRRIAFRRIYYSRYSI